MEAKRSDVYRDALTADDLSRLNLEHGFEKLPVLDVVPRGLRDVGITPSTLNDEAFRKTLRVDSGGHIVFRHRDAHGPCSLERVHAATIGTRDSGSISGDRGLWTTPCRENVDRIVVVTSPFEALAYHQLHPSKSVAYVSVGKEPLTPRQQEAVRSALQASQARSRQVIVAVGRDAKSQHVRKELFGVARDVARAGPLRLKEHTPPRTDWRSCLKDRVAQQQLAR